MYMIKIDVTLMDPLGLHARPAAKFVETAKQFKDTSVKVIKESREVDAKSIIGIMSLGAKQGSVLTITAEGPDETEAVQTLKNLINQGDDEGQ